MSDYKYNIQNIPLTSLVVSKQNARSSMIETQDEETTLASLTSNINQYGLLNPITVCKSDKNDAYEIIAGQRRFHAVKTLEWETVPCNVMECKNKESAELISLAENVQRAPMSTKDKCYVFNRLNELHGGDTDELSKLTSLSVLTLKRYLKISQGLSHELHDFLDEKGESKLTLEIANLLMKTFPEKKDQQAVYEKIKDLKNSQKKKVIETLGEQKGTDIDSILSDLQKKNEKNKEFNKIKKNPWVWDKDKNPVSIPDSLHKAVYKLIK